jgi:hypothetical protein
MCSVFACSIFALIRFNTNRNKTYFKSKIGEPIMESLKEGVKFVFNKTILGALSLDMVYYFMEQWHFTFFAQDILKVGPEGFGVLRAAAVGSFLTLIVSAYVPMNKKCRFEALGSILLSDFASLL